MTAGLSAANFANPSLNVLRGITFTGIAAVFVKLHVGDPGASGANNAAALSTTRPAITWAVPSGGAMSMTGTAPSWTAGAGSGETITHISFWDSASAGNFIDSCALGTSQAWATGNVFALSSQSWAYSPIAA